jgi:hypothetical protein
MSGFWLIPLGVDLVLASFAIVSVLRHRKEPVAMLCWVMAILLLPYFGLVLYGLLGSHWVVRQTQRRRQRVAHLIAKLEAWSMQRADGTAEETDFPEDLRAIAGLGRHLVDMPATRDNAVGIYQESEVTFAALEEAIRAAKHHIHAEYYIWRPMPPAIGLGWVFLDRPPIHPPVYRGRRPRRVFPAAPTVWKAAQPADAEPPQDRGGGWRSRFHGQPEHRRRVPRPTEEAQSLV